MIKWQWKITRYEFRKHDATLKMTWKWRVLPTELKNYFLSLVILYSGFAHIPPHFDAIISSSLASSRVFSFRGRFREKSLTIRNYFKLNLKRNFVEYLVPSQKSLRMTMYHSLIVESICDTLFVFICDRSNSDIRN